MQPKLGHSVVCWGCGEFGQHGQSGNPDDVGYSNGAVHHSALKDNVVLAACGSSHTVVLTVDGELYTWGNGAFGHLISADVLSAVLLVARTPRPALGTGNLSNISEPTRIQLDPPPPSGVAVSSLACGSRHTMVLLTNGQVYAFGNNFYAQLGYDFRKETYKENQASPGLLRYLVHHHVTQVACGDKHTLFLFQGGAVSAVGHNSRGQIGDGGRQESVVPKAVDLEAPAVSIACGRDHNLVLTESGDVYAWGSCKGCGHRKTDVLSPELKLQGRQVVQVAGGATHSLALTRDGIIFAWGFGADGQLGLGERNLTSYVPRRVRHESLRHRVSYIDCGETFSAAVTADGRLYMWGKNSHVIAVSHAPSKSFFYPVAVDQDEQLETAHSVHCGSWHAIAMAGRPERQPITSEDVSDSESGSDRDLTSGSSVRMSEPGNKADQVADDEGSNPFAGADSPLEKSVPPRGHQDQGTPSPTRYSPETRGNKAAKKGPPGLMGRGQTKLTIGEFYAMSDSSPSLHENGSCGSVTQDRDASDIDKEHQAGEPETNVPPIVTIESPQSQGKFDTPDSFFHKETKKDHENLQSSPEPKPTKHHSAPASAKSSSGSSEVSESSLKKRMAENLSANVAFRSRESWGVHPQTLHKQLLNKPNPRSPSKPLPLASASPMGLSPRSPNLIHRARSTEIPAPAIDRSHTMFISRTPAEQFLLPRREPTFMACQSLALVDLNELRQGSVFDHEVNGGQSHTQGHIEGHLQGNFQLSGTLHGSRSGSSTAASRLDMVSSPADCDAELSQVLRQRTPLMTTFPHLLAMSETPNAMSVSQHRAHDMMGLLPPESSVMFATPSPNLSRQVSNPLLRRSRTMYSRANVRGAGKFYRKPGLPGAGYKPVTVPGPVRPLLKQTTSLDSIPKSRFQNGEGIDLAILTPKQSALKTLHNQKTGNTNGFDDVSGRKAVYSSATSWRTRSHTSLSLGKDSPPTIPVKKNAQLHLNGIGAKNGNAQLDSKTAVGTHALSKLDKLNTLSTTRAFGGKIANFSDIQREPIPKSQIQGVEIKAKSVKKYR